MQKIFLDHAVNLREQSTAGSRIIVAPAGLNALLCFQTYETRGAQKRGMGWDGMGWDGMDKWDTRRDPTWRNPGLRRCPGQFCHGQFGNDKIGSRRLPVPAIAGGYSYPFLNPATAVSCKQVAFPSAPARKVLLR